MQQPWTEVLARLRPVLEPILAAYGVSPQQAQEIVEEACLVLMSNRPELRDPETWLVRTILEKCEELARRRGGARPRPGGDE